MTVKKGDRLRLASSGATEVSAPPLSIVVASQFLARSPTLTVVLPVVAIAFVAVATIQYLPSGGGVAFVLFLAILLSGLVGIWLYSLPARLIQAGDLEAAIATSAALDFILASTSLSHRANRVNRMYWHSLRNEHEAVARIASDLPGPDALEADLRLSWLLSQSNASFQKGEHARSLELEALVGATADEAGIELWLDRHVRLASRLVLNGLPASAVQELRSSPAPADPPTIALEAYALASQRDMREAMQRVEEIDNAGLHLPGTELWLRLLMAQFAWTKEWDLLARLTARLAIHQDDYPDVLGVMFFHEILRPLAAGDTAGALDGYRKVVTQCERTAPDVDLLGVALRIVRDFELGHEAAELPSVQLGKWLIMPPMTILSLATTAISYASPKAAVCLLEKVSGPLEQLVGPVEQFQQAVLLGDVYLFSNAPGEAIAIYESLDPPADSFQRGLYLNNLSWAYQLAGRSPKRALELAMGSIECLPEAHVAAVTYQCAQILNACEPADTAHSLRSRLTKTKNVARHDRVLILTLTTTSATRHGDDETLRWATAQLAEASNVTSVS